MTQEINTTPPPALEGGSLSPRVSKSDEHSAVSRWRKRPVVIEARQLSRENGPELAAWSGGHWHSLYGRGDDGEDISHVAIVTLEGRMTADLGDWIIRGVKGEFYPCKPDIFAATYEPTNEAREPDTRGEANTLAGMRSEIERLREVLGDLFERSREVRIEGRTLAFIYDNHLGPRSVELNCRAALQTQERTNGR